MQFLYFDGDQATFMDDEIFEQIAVERELIGEPADFLHEGMICTVQLYEGAPLSVTCRRRVTMEVVEADPVVKGQTASSSYKPGKLENGRRVMLPPHIGRRHAHRRQHRRRQLCRTRQGLIQQWRSARRSFNVMAGAALKAARGLIRDFGEVEQLQVSVKGPGDFVSTADLKAERMLRDELQRARRGFGFLMEESGETAGSDARHRWIVDPLDGTTNFLHGMPHSAISIALERDGEIVAGVVYEPIRDEMFWAEKGIGAYVNDRRLRVSARRQLGDAVIGTGMPVPRARRPPRLSRDPGAR